MNPPHSATRRGLVLLLILAVVPTESTAQSAWKRQWQLQIGEATLVPNPRVAWSFAFEPPDEPYPWTGQLSLPSNTAITFSVPAYYPFTDKAALDAKFPPGVYRLSSLGQRERTPDFTIEDFPGPLQIIGGRWNNGVLLLDPARENTISATLVSGWGVINTSEGCRIYRDWGEVADRIYYNNGPESPAWVTLPANKLKPGLVYDGLMSAWRFNASGAGFLRDVRFSILAQAAGTTLPAPPVITSQPGDVAVAPDGSATLTVGTAGATEIRWFKDGNELRLSDVSVEGGRVVINKVTDDHAGEYLAQVANAGGVVYARAATLTVTRATFPAQRLTISPGSTVALNAPTTDAVDYQWRRDGVTIPNATGAILLLSGANAVSGNYTVTARASESTPVTLSTVAGGEPGRLTNLSIRGRAGAGDQTSIVGFFVSGSGTSNSAPLLLRAVGPSLSQFGVTGLLGDPVATLLQGSTSVATNDDWAGNAQVVARATQVGAFALAGSASLDAALATSAAPGSYSLQITGKNNTAGTVLGEIYDASNSPATASAPRLVNLSARARVTAATEILIAGLTVSGTTARTVLVRAIGPNLAGFGVAGALADPQLRIFQGATLVRENDNWGGDAQLVDVARNVGAFRLSDGSSRDAVLLVTLPPGSYTAQISGAANDAGVALVEIYEVP